MKDIPQHIIDELIALVEKDIPQPVTIVGDSKECSDIRKILFILH